MTIHLSDVFHSGISLILPETCPICKKGLADHPSPICSSCRRAVFSSPSCPPLSTPDIEEIWSCRPYEGALRDCIREFKYRGARKMSWVFSLLISSFFAEIGAAPEAADMLIPVPLHPKKLKARGYNQAELIAGIFSETLSTRLCRRALFKIRETPPQMGLSREKRLENLRGAFVVADKLAVAGRTVLLIDDVMTTGATLETCAKELLRSGAACVKAFTIARVI